MEYWGILQKSATDNTTIDEAIAEALANYQYFTTVSVWGMLQKSGVDDETIEEAINRLIAVHEADATAHLGTGESLEAHKSADVIDHPAGSVLADKKAMTEFDFNTYFETLEPWNKEGNVTNILWPGITLSYTTEDLPDPVNCAVSCIMSTDFSTIRWDRYNLFECNINEEIQADSYNLFVGFYYRVSDSDVRGIGFRIVDNVIYGFCGVSGDVHFTASIGSGIHLSRNLRVEWISETQQANFYINGSLVASIILGYTPSTQNDLRPRCQLLYRGGSDDAVVHLQNIRIAGAISA
jgi:hypothetical protein